MSGITMDGMEHLLSDEVKVVQPTDKAGNSMKLQVIDGVYYGVGYNPNILRAMKDVQLREDDVYLCSYLRTGTHWTFEILCMLLNGKAETIKKFKGRNQLEFTSSEDLSYLPSPRVINTHVPLSHAPTQLAEKKCRIVYPLRDPKDAAVSYYCAITHCVEYIGYEGSFKDFLDLYYEGKLDSNGLFESWRAADKFFQENPDIPVHFTVYEEMKENPLKAVQDLSDFLGLPRNDELCHAIAFKCHFKNMVKDKDDYSLKVHGKSILFRRGEVGDWRNYFTEEMLEEYYTVYEEKMAGTRFYQRYARKT